LDVQSCTSCIYRASLMSAITQSMKRSFAGKTDTGLVRSVNQDSYYIDSDGRFFIVADGMGGHAGGQEASRIAIQAIQSYLVEHWEEPSDTPLLLEKAFLIANQAILTDQLAHPERADMGTTAVAVIFRDEGRPWCANIVDSRLYRLHGSHLDQITEDQTWVAQAVKRKALTPEQARNHPWRHVLSQCLGRDDLHEIDILPVDVQPGDRLLLCSDGLTEELSDPLIASPLKSIRACEGAATALIEAAKDKGGRDNITVVIVTLDLK
jgi:PPM family protein phosphatase